MKCFLLLFAACEALCDAEPSGRCRYFTHSIRFKMCILCAACEPEIALGDDTFASFQRATEDATTPKKMDCIFAIFVR